MSAKTFKSCRRKKTAFLSACRLGADIMQCVTRPAATLVHDRLAPRHWPQLLCGCRCCVNVPSPPFWEVLQLRCFMLNDLLSFLLLSPHISPSSSLSSKPHSSLHVHSIQSTRSYLHPLDLIDPPTALSLHCNVRLSNHPTIAATTETY